VPPCRYFTSEQLLDTIKGNVAQYRVTHRVRSLAGRWFWIESHGKQVEAYQNSDYEGAVEQALAPSAVQFAEVERSLRDELEQTRGTLRDEVSAAGAWLAWSPTGTLVLMTLAAAAAVVGLWPRLKEFL